jgi:hypothetical protein
VSGVRHTAWASGLKAIVNQNLNRDRRPEPDTFAAAFAKPTTLVLRRRGVAGVHQDRRAHRKVALLRGEDSCSGLITRDHCRFL